MANIFLPNSISEKVRYRVKEKSDHFQAAFRSGCGYWQLDVSELK